MFNRGEFKTAAKSKLKGNWGVVIAIFFIFMVMEFIVQYFLGDKGFLFSIGVGIITAPIYLSLAKISLNISTGEGKPRVSQLLYGFTNIIKGISVYVIMTISIMVGIIFLIVPGIIISLMFSQAIYVLADNPEIGIIEALKESVRMTKGYKWKMFLLQLSFLGLIILGMITLGIGLLWVMPYMQVTMAEAYIYLKNQQLNKEVN